MVNGAKAGRFGAPTRRIARQFAPQQKILTAEEIAERNEKALEQQKKRRGKEAERRIDEKIRELEQAKEGKSSDTKAIIDEQILSLNQTRGQALSGNFDPDDVIRFALTKALAPISRAERGRLAERTRRREINKIIQERGIQSLPSGDVLLDTGEVINPNTFQVTSPPTPTESALQQSLQPEFRNLPPSQVPTAEEVRRGQSLLPPSETTPTQTEVDLGQSLIEGTRDLSVDEVQSLETPQKPSIIQRFGNILSSSGTIGEANLRLGEGGLRKGLRFGRVALFGERAVQISDDENRIQTELQTEAPILESKINQFSDKVNSIQARIDRGENPRDEINALEVEQSELEQEIMSFEFKQAELERLQAEREASEPEGISKSFAPVGEFIEKVELPFITKEGEVGVRNIIEESDVLEQIPEQTGQLVESGIRKLQLSLAKESSVENEKQIKDVRTITELATGVGVFTAGAPVFALSGIQKFSEPSRTEAERLSGALDVAIVGTVGGLSGVKALKKPILFIQEKKQVDTISEVLNVNVLNLDRQIQTGQFLQVGARAERKAFVTTRGQLLKQKILGVNIGEKATAQELKFLKGQFKTIEKPALASTLSEPLVIKEGKIVGAFTKDKRFRRQAFTITTKISDTGAETSKVLSRLEGEVGKESIKLSKLDRRKLTATEKKLLKEIESRLPVGKIESRIDIQKGFVKTTEFGRTTKTGKFISSKVGGRTRQAELLSATELKASLSLEKDLGKISEQLLKERIALRDVTKIPVPRTKKLSKIVLEKTDEGITISPKIKLTEVPPRKVSQITGDIRIIDFKVPAKEISPFTFKSFRKTKGGKQIGLQKQKQLLNQQLRKAGTIAKGGQSLELKKVLKSTPSPKLKVLKSATQIKTTPKLLSIPARPVGIQQESLKSVQLPKEKIKSLALPKTATTPLSKEITRLDTRLTPRLVTRQVPRTVSRQVPRLVPKEITKLDVRLVPKLAPRLVTRQVPRIPPTTTIPQFLPPTIPKITKPFKPFLFKLPLEKKRRRKRTPRRTLGDLALAEGFTARALKLPPLRIPESKLPDFTKKFQTAGLRRRPLIIKEPKIPEMRLKI